MNRIEPRESATIIPFPGRGARGALRRPEAVIEAELPVVDVASAGAWYHEAAMHENEPAGKH